MDIAFSSLGYEIAGRGLENRMDRNPEMKEFDSVLDGVPPTGADRDAEFPCPTKTGRFESGTGCIRGFLTLRAARLRKEIP
jgi:hypothetical protein